MSIIYDVKNQKLSQNNFARPDYEKELQDLCKVIGGEPVTLDVNSGTVMNILDMCEVEDNDIKSGEGNKQDD